MRWGRGERGGGLFLAMEGAGDGRVRGVGWYVMRLVLGGGVVVFDLF